MRFIYLLLEVFELLVHSYYYRSYLDKIILMLSENLCIFLLIYNEIMVKPNMIEHSCLQTARARFKNVHDKPKQHQSVTRTTSCDVTFRACHHLQGLQLQVN